ncbi:MAG: hypothetical protein ACREKS_23390 [Candidatus Rokuibacteriota bacterium]
MSRPDTWVDGGNPPLLNPVCRYAEQLEALAAGVGLSEPASAM